LSVQGAGIRIQAMRFALLIVLTVALASVAVRINSHSSSTSSKPPAAAPSSGSSSSPPTHPQSSPPQSSPPQSPSVQPTHATRAPRTAGHGGTGHGGASSGQAGGPPQQLPVTGWDPAMKLGALAFVLIGGGMLTIRAAGPRRPRQRLTVQD
jgi:hypothetical protein